MIVTLWYNVDEQQPATKGWYVAKKEVSMGDDETDVGWYHWGGRSWSDSDTNGRHASVSYWTDVDFNNAIFIRGKLNVTEQAAYNEIKESIERFNVIRALSNKHQE